MKTLLHKIKTNQKLALTLILAGLILGFLIGKMSSSSDNTPATEHEHHEESTQQVWTCSMHPQIKQDKPGLCPICAMDLVPMESTVNDAEHIDPNEIEMTESALALASVQTTVVKRAVPQKELRLLGKVKEDERRIARLTARFGGRIEDLMVNYTGQEVKKGQILGTIYSPELITAQKELLEASAYKDSKPSFYESARAKLRLWDLTEAQINNIERLGQPQNSFEVLSPISGTVTQRNISIGDYIKEGSPLFEVADLSKIWLLFDAYESDLPWIHRGDSVWFTLPALPGQSFAGVVRFIDPVLNAQTRVAQVRVEYNNASKMFKPEMYANGIFKASIGDTPQLLIPKSSVLWTGKRAVVYVKVPDRAKVSFINQQVTLGADAGDFYVVSQGLMEGEEVASNGIFKIDAAAQLAGKTSMMNPGEESTSSAQMHDAMLMGDSEHEMAKAAEATENSSSFEHAMFKVWGNCEMCKETIETAVKALPGIQDAEWNIETKMLHLSYQPKLISLPEIHKAIAKVGYDTELEKADDEVYQQLPECCQYTRE